MSEERMKMFLDPMEEKLSPMYFDRKGNELNQRQWGALFDDPTYRLVKRDVVGPYTISTVWVGIYNMAWNYGSGIPIIFETMIFSPTKEDSEFENYIERYSTEEEALRGHEIAVELVKNKKIRET